MRLLLLPISTRRALIYAEPPSHLIPNTQQSYIDKAANWSSRTWSTWEKTEEGLPLWKGGWKLKTTQYGNKALRRVPFEEWGLKSIPGLTAKRKQELDDSSRNEKIEVRFPRLFQGLSNQPVLRLCDTLSTARQGLHRKRMWQSIAGMPVTIPFGLLPIVPNLPFFYLCFRAYSHWRALNGSWHLAYLSSHNLLTLHPSDTLDSLYSAGLLHTTRGDSRKAADPTPEQSKQVVRLIRRQMKGEDLREGERDVGDADGDGEGGGGRVAEFSKPGVNIGGGVSDDLGKVEVKAPPKHARRHPVRQDPGGGDESLGSGVPAEEEEIMLLKGWNGKLIAERLGLPGLEVEIERAVEQVEGDLQKGDELGDEKREIERAAAGKDQGRGKVKESEELKI